MFFKTLKRGADDLGIFLTPRAVKPLLPKRSNLSQVCSAESCARMENFPLAVQANRAYAEQDYSSAIALLTEALEEEEDNCLLLW